MGSWRSALVGAGVALLVGCSCGREAGNEPDAASVDATIVDAAIREDATEDRLDAGQTDAQEDGPCSFAPLAPRLPPPPSHETLVTYDRYLYYELGRNCPRQIFADADGIAIFGTLRFMRASLDGELIRTVEYPIDPVTGNQVGFGHIAQSPFGYGVSYLVTLPDGSGGPAFCLFREDGPTDLSSCAQLPSYSSSWAWPAWDGTHFRLVGRLDADTRYVARYDSAGVFVDQVTSPPGWPTAWVQPHFFGNHALLIGDLPGTICQPWVVDVMGLSLDVAEARTFALLPPDALMDSGPLVRSSGRRAAMLYRGRCTMQVGVDPCGTTWPAGQSGTFLTIVGEDGTPLEPRREVPLPMHPLEWDGTRFVYFTRYGRGHGLTAFDEDGVTTIENAYVPLAWDRGHEVLDDRAGAQVVPVGENDYVAVYCLVDNGETWIARFQVGAAL